ncbi:MAG: acyl-CoA dehydrogenase family protein [Polyangiaceae bacterium]|nr:acyl-CoA dehydrogenase family protein [Polyangiaceae bacterium]MCW5789359.1 acyl-CoA dehydrogenase family protein [Polyangiaceae bacterium]
MLNLEIPKKLKPLLTQASQVAEHVFRPISRKYDLAEHAYPKELDLLAAAMDGMNSAGGVGAGAGELSRKQEEREGVKNGANMATVLGLAELCWGDVGLALSIPRQGLGNSAIAAVATPEQKRAFGATWAAMAITEPNAGSDSSAIRTTARRDGDEWVLNGEKIFVTAGERAGSVVVWATLDASLGRAAIKSFVVPKGTPGMEVVRLEKKLGIRASDTATVSFTDCRVPLGNILGSPEIDPQRGFAGVMQTFDNTRPVVAAMAIGIARAALELTRQLLAPEGVKQSYRGVRFGRGATEAELDRLEAEWEASRLLTLRAAWMADNGRPNSMEASMAKAKAGRTATEICLRAVELCGAAGYSERELLEKWARDAKILDIFEGTQQIQMLIVARRLLGKKSSELR